MMEDGNDQSNFLKGLLFGSILGVVGGIFFAPKSGKELRSEIKEKGSKVLKDAEEIYEEATGICDDVQRHAEDLKRGLVKLRQMAKQIVVPGEKTETRGGN
jgi:gas vesicle protein